MLEASQHEESSFATLTYDDSHLPVDGSLYPAHLQLFFKRLRKALRGRSIRYFAAGEYGDRTKRPHYHAAIFGLGSCQAAGLVVGECPCPHCSVVRATWGYGHVMLGELSICSAAYIGGYVVKKLTRRDDPALEGRHPEFARMSLKPGIGAAASMAVASAMMPYRFGLSSMPTALRHSSIGSTLPLGRYLRRKIGELVELPISAGTGPLRQELQLVREFASSTGKSVKEVFSELAGEAPRYKERGTL